MLADIRQSPAFIYLRTTHSWLPITNDGDKCEYGTSFSRFLTLNNINSSVFKPMYLNEVYHHLLQRFYCAIYFRQTTAYVAFLPLFF